MKKILWLLAASTMLLSSCVTKAPENVVKEEEKQKENPAEEVVVKTEIIDVYLVSGETLKASDGVVDGYIEYKYDEKGNLLERVEYDGEKNQKNRMVNVLSGDKIVRTQWFSDEEETPGVYILREYEGMNLIKEISYNIKDIPQSISSYDYDSSDNMVKWTVSTGDNVPMMVSEYEYINGRKSKAMFLTPLGELEGYIEYLWNSENLESETTFDNDGNLEKSVIYEYENGKLVKEIHYRKTVVDYSIEYELDENGMAKIKKHFYRSGNQKAQWDYEYISVKKEVQL